MRVNPASFRDPAGRVFESEGRVYRAIYEPGIGDYRAATEDGAYQKLIDADFLLPHAEVDPAVAGVEDARICLEHPRLPMVSYPWEWPFSLLQDAALLHLDIMEELIPRGYWLRDANAFNVQFDGRRLKLIDTLSIGRRGKDRPWVAYKQFCSQFLAPLAVASKSDIRLLGLWRSYLDGFPLDLAVKLLPGSARLNPRFLMHLYLHARMQKSADSKEQLHETSAREVRVSDTALVGLVRSLRKAVQGLSYRPDSAIWQGYTELRTYNDEDVNAKSEFIGSVIAETDPAVVWDFGGNTGEFSEIAARGGAFVLSVDSDPACTEFLYNRLRSGEVAGRILPLTMDLSNPSPGLGFNQEERFGLKQRGPADLLLALALIHHLVLTASVPLEKVAQWFSQISRRLLIEFVPESDPMVQKLLANRGDEHLPYAVDIFRQAFLSCYELEREQELQNGRTLFLFRNRAGC